MKSFQLFFLVLLLGLHIGCEPGDPCIDVECGPGDCVEGICDCPCGFSGVNCEIEDLCSGVVCCNGICDPQTESCNCNPNFYGLSCNVYCVNGEFANGRCNCSEGYEGFACDIESRNGFLGWWSCEQWTWTSEIGDSIFQGGQLGSLKFDCGDSIPEVVLFPTENSSGLMLLHSDNRIVGRVTENIINFESQSIFPQIPYSKVYGSARQDGPSLNIELYLFNPSTSLTEIVRGEFSILRYHKDCD